MTGLGKDQVKSSSASSDLTSTLRLRSGLVAIRALAVLNLLPIEMKVMPVRRFLCLRIRLGSVVTL